ncbi:Oidioi.mRNA.OKI2018_I69.chr2.g5692.t1.cds [Oikopleura dioica]|uniref:Oidioi.mRNA.OKI2018_I69.chr2.g5692.t1.cds n=1 Tax=Oikopleura dioica TaxID=34765 RepID=A0ABN7T6R2_OIKDI|nr:Oidioi.mRNA.OKI2018_I69.chr2.g5692.t1.cds [Oikopleura dioica]
MDFTEKPFAITYIQAIEGTKVIFDHIIVFWSYEDGFYIENNKSKETLTDLVYSLSKRFTFRMDPDDDIEDVVSVPDIPTTAVVKTPLEHRDTSFLELYKLLVNFKNPYYHNKKLAKANY